MFVCNSWVFVNWETNTAIPASLAADAHERHLNAAGAGCRRWKSAVRRRKFAGEAPAVNAMSAYVDTRANNDTTPKMTSPDNKEQQHRRFTGLIKNSTEPRWG